MECPTGHGSELWAHAAEEVPNSLISRVLTQARGPGVSRARQRDGQNAMRREAQPSAASEGQGRRKGAQERRRPRLAKLEPRPVRAYGGGEDAATDDHPDSHRNSVPSLQRLVKPTPVILARTLVPRAQAKLRSFVGGKWKPQTSENDDVPMPASPGACVPLPELAAGPVPNPCHI